MDFAGRQNALNRAMAFAVARSEGSVPRSFIGGANHYTVNPTAVIRNRVGQGLPLRVNNGHSPRIMAPKGLAYHLDVLSILGTSPRQALRDLWRQPGSPNGASLGYFTFGEIH